MDGDDVRTKILVQAELDSSPYLNWTDPSGTHAIVYGAFQPETQYTLTVPEGAHDRFGRAIRTPVSLHFRTPAGLNSPTAAPVNPQALVVSPGLISTFDAYAHPRDLVRTTNASPIEYSVDSFDAS